jgi:hypothetical protein
MDTMLKLRFSFLEKALPFLLLASTIDAAADMPVGIPAPSFGINEVAPNQPAAWPGGEAAGFYYIDNTHPDATDSSNAYGYPDRPRVSIPNNITFPAGTYIEVHGGPYEGGQLINTFDCTQESPCWFRGQDADTMPTIRYQTIAKGSYVIFEYLKFDADGKGVGFRSHNTSSLHHAALRYSEITGSGTATKQNHAAVSVSGNSTHRFTDIVIIGNHIPDLGDHAPDVPENDYHGVHPDLYSDRIWILENQIYHMGGDSVQIGRAQTDSDTYSSHIYVGKNNFHDNHEDTIDIKKANDVIISENKLHDLPEVGALVVVHDHPDNVWILNNEMYHSNVGVASVSASNVWTINNLIRDINHNQDETFSPNDAYQHGAAVHYRGTNGGIVNNTFVRTDFGIELAAGPGPYSIVGNIFADRSESDAWDVLAPSSSITSISELDYNIFTSSKINWNSSSTPTLTSVQTSLGVCLNCFSGPETPQFLNRSNNFDIGPDSKARDTGIEHSCFDQFYERYGLPAHFALDRSNRKQTGTQFDIGAYEYNDGSVGMVSPSSPSNLSVY